MSFTRIKYDESAYNLKTNRTVEPGDYRLYLGSNESCSKCSLYDGPRNSKSDVSIAQTPDSNQWYNMTEVESRLTNRVNKLIDYNDYGRNDSYKNVAVLNNNNCTTNNLIPEETRFSNPIEEYRGMDLTEFHYNPYLSVNAQCEYLEDRIGLNSRLRIKDTYVVKKPNLIDQSIFMPSE